MDNPLVQPDVGLYIWTIITFLTLLWALRRYAWGPLLQALDARQETIRQSLDEAEQARKELAQAQETAAQVITDARVESQSILADSRNAAEAFKEESRQQAKAEAEAVVAAAQRQIQQETARAMQEIRRETVDLSLQIASKLIRKNLTPEDNDALIRESTLGCVMEVCPLPRPDRPRSRRGLPAAGFRSASPIPADGLDGPDRGGSSPGPRGAGRSQDVLDHFKAGGPGWQTRMNDALREWIAKHDTA